MGLSWAWAQIDVGVIVGVTVIVGVGVGVGDEIGPMVPATYCLSSHPPYGLVLHEGVELHTFES